jgi:23S rRNA pseudouridine2605 synthase
MSPPTEEAPVRLHHFLAQLGVASRRACEALIAAGRVRVDGRVVRAPGERVVPGRHAVTVDGAAVTRPPRRTVLLLHKPTGVVSTVSDPMGRPTVTDLCRRYARRTRLFPVGRLDVNTTGALLLTNDGLLCYRLTHPRYGVPRVYQVRARGAFDRRKLARLERMAGAVGRGEDRGTSPGVQVVKELEGTTVLRVTLVEGRNRQVRRMCEAVGLRVTRLARLSFGPVSIRGLPVGAARPLEPGELAKLDQLLAKGEPKGDK